VYKMLDDDDNIKAGIDKCAYTYQIRKQLKNLSAKQSKRKRENNDKNRTNESAEIDK